MGAAVLEMSAYVDDTIEGFSDRIGTALKRSLSDFVYIGSELARAKSALSDSDFRELWEKRLEISYSSAMRFMRIANDPRLLQFPQVENPVPDLKALDKLQSLPDHEFEACLFHKARTLDDIKAVVGQMRTAHQHAPGARPPAPARAALAGASTYAELVYSLIEWRKARGLSQAALDDKILWGEGQTSHYEIGHTEDGKIFTLWSRDKGRDGTLFDYLAGLGLGLAVVPLR